MLNLLLQDSILRVKMKYLLALCFFTSCAVLKDPKVYEDAVEMGEEIIEDIEKAPHPLDKKEVMLNVLNKRF